MPTQTLFENAEHKNVLLEDFTSGNMVQTNQHVIVHKGQAMLLDPGGHGVYAAAMAELSTAIPTMNDLKYIFFSHQDPDIVAAANAWLMVTDARGLLPAPWMRFIVHFGVDELVFERIDPIPDEGVTVDLEGCRLLVIPAHFMHSAANFQVYDPVAKILYTGDLGASFGQSYTIVENFDEHVQYMAPFHKRYIPANSVLKAWAAMVRQLEINAIAPQHGAMLMGKKQVIQFIAWVENLACGIATMGQVYKLPQ